MQEEERKWFVGVDWGREAHHVVVCDANGKKLDEKQFPHSGAGLSGLSEFILKVTGATPNEVSVAIETPYGPVVDSLMERGFRLRAINPRQLDRFRDRFSPAGAKDDSRDGHVLSSAIRTDPHCFRALTALDPVVIELREWSRMAEELSVERNKFGNQVREQLWRYYPQILELTDDVTAEWFLALWTLLPTPDDARRVREDRIAHFLKRYRIRRFGAAQALECLRQPAITVAAGTTKAATAHLKLLIKRLRLVNSQIAETEEKLDRLTDALARTQENEPGQRREQRDVAILRSFPGLGRIVTATLLAEASEALQRRDYHGLRCLCGVAPVTRQSGKSRTVRRRRAAHPRLANAVYHWSRVAVQRDPTCRSKYNELRARGHSHGRALRSVGDRLLKVVCVMLQNQTTFDPNREREKAHP